MRTNLGIRHPRQAALRAGRSNSGVGHPSVGAGRQRLLPAAQLACDIRDRCRRGVSYTGAPTLGWRKTPETRTTAADFLQVQYNSGMSDRALVRFALPSLSFKSVAGATLGLYYYDQSSMTANNAALDHTLSHHHGIELVREHL